MLHLDAFIRALYDEGDAVECELTCRRANGVSAEQVYNAAALEIARRFDDGNMTYEDADSAANALWTFMIPDEDGPFNPPEPAYSVYEAFDDGEYSHGDEKDPVQAYTIPQIKRILAGA